MNKSVIRFIALLAVTALVICSMPVAGVFAAKTVVHQIDVTGVAEPVVGQHPVFNAGIDSDLCRVDTDFHNEDSETVNGVYWIEYEKDDTFVRAMTEADVFREGYNYLFGVIVVTADSAEFGNFYAEELDATVNGEAAAIWPYADYVAVTRVFHCGYVIDMIDITVEYPIVGGSPAFAKTETVRYESKNDFPALENQINGVTWTRSDLEQEITMGQKDKFVKGGLYTYAVSLYAKDGYTFAADATVYVNGQNADFRLEGGHAVVSIVFEPIVGNPFIDVPEGKWYTDAVLWCYEKDYMAGTSDVTFDPNGVFTRAMFVTVLAKIDGADVSGYTGTSFDDVPAGKWYSAPVEWAFKNGYASGIGGGKFAPNSPVTREQLARFLYNYSFRNGYTGSPAADVSGYPDYKDISNYAKDAVGWAVGNGLISGIKQGDVIYLSPKGNATRAQVALIVKNYVENVLHLSDAK